MRKLSLVMCLALVAVLASCTTPILQPKRQVVATCSDFTPLFADLPGTVDGDRVQSALGRERLKIIDCRTKMPDYNAAHIPGSLYLSVEGIRSNVDGIPGMLASPEILAAQLSAMGVQPADTVVFVADELRNMTYLAVAMMRLGQCNYAILDGGIGKWRREARPVTSALPSVLRSDYKPLAANSNFIVDYKGVLAHVQDGSAVILDVRPQAYYTGEKSEEARAGHIPGAINRPLAEDMETLDGYSVFKPQHILDKAYRQIIPAKLTTVIVHCRTGHEASQTFFLLTHILGYRNVLFYDGGWVEWAAHPELPVETGMPAAPATEEQTAEPASPPAEKSTEPASPPAEKSTEPAPAPTEEPAAPAEPPAPAAEPAADQNM